MFETNANSTLNLFISIADSLKECKLEKSRLLEMNDKIKRAAEFLGCSEEGVIFFSIIFMLQNDGSCAVTMHDIADFLDYPFIHLLGFRSVISELEDASLIYLYKRKNVSRHEENNGYIINGTVMNNVIDGTPVIHCKKEKETTETILGELNYIEDNFCNDVMNAAEYERQITNYENKHSENPAVKNICGLFEKDFESRLILYALSYQLIIGERLIDDDGTNPNKIFEILPSSNRIARKRLLSDGEDILLKEDYVQKEFNSINDSPFARGVNVSFSLTKNGIQKIFGAEAENYLGDIHEENELEKVHKALAEMAAIYESKQRGKATKRHMLKNCEEKNKVLPFFANIQKVINNETYRYFLYDCLNDHEYFHACTNLHSTLTDIYGEGTDEFYKEFRLFQEEKHPLIEDGFLEIVKADLADNARIEVGERTMELLYGANADIFLKKNTDKNVLEPEKLAAKTLYYSDEVQGQIDMLAESLEQKNLVAMQERLEKKGLPKGIATILYGAPGTGKTESVYQIAKKTNRKILHVDISESKSMWFGESEKKIKKIFTNYRALCRSCATRKENTPILLFNEADAIISTRKEIGSSSVDQTENAMQNILLEEMEKLDGIMIATTNLCENMDKAFERRFLFKVKFEKPSVESRTKIWKSKMPDLSEQDALTLAEQFDFSGGEIDNIVRKCEISEIIHGTKSDLACITDFCKNERLASESNGRRIGFEN